MRSTGNLSSTSKLYYNNGFSCATNSIITLLLALGGSSWPSQMHEVTYDFLVVHIKVSQKSLGDKPKSVYIFLQTPHEVYTRKSYFLDNSADKHPILTNYVSIPILAGSRSMIRLLLL